MLKLNHVIFKAAFLLILFTEISKIYSTTFDVPEGTILNSPPIITGPLIKDGLGEIDLNTANTFKNGVQIKAGTVLIKNNSSLGKQATVEFVNAGGALTTAPLSSGVATISLTSVKVDKDATTALLAPSDNTI